MNATVDGARFVGDGVFFLEMFDEVVEGSGVGILNSKVVDDEGELN